MNFYVPSLEVAEAMAATIAYYDACPTCGYCPVGTAWRQVAAMAKHRRHEHGVKS